MRIQTCALGVALCVALSVRGQQPPTNPKDYVFRTGDRVQYRIAEDPVKAPIPITVPVTTVGEASFPVSRDSDLRITLSVRGKTLEEVRQELTRRLLAEYYHKATVELTLAEKVITPGKVQFFGEITGEIPIHPDTPPIMLSDAVLRLRRSDYADLRRVRVHRVNPDTGESREIKVNVKAIIEDGRRSEDIVLQDGDRVEVPTKWIN
jgi:protein involved in polysaccharide export with SLBB domain